MCLAGGRGGGGGPSLETDRIEPGLQPSCYILFKFNFLFIGLLFYVKEVNHGGCGIERWEEVSRKVWILIGCVKVNSCSCYDI